MHSWHACYSCDVRSLCQFWYRHHPFQRQQDHQYLRLNNWCIIWPCQPPIHPPISSQPLNEHTVMPPTQQQHNAESTEQRKAHQLDASSALARHMLAHVKYRRFGDRKSVAAWCRENNSEVSILWRAPTISLMKNAQTKHCRLCAMERVKLFSTFRDKKRGCKLLNAGNEIRGHWSCRTQFLWFYYKPGRKGGSEVT